MKVQYPGVAKSIDSDIRNLMSLISVMAFLPDGLFIDNIAKHMSIELAQVHDDPQHHPEHHVLGV